MSSYDKVVRLACKPKHAPPKAKYLDPIVAATWSEDGAVHDVCKALVPRLREPNAIVVFKALIVLHTMIRNGATDNVLSHLSSSEVLRLRNISTGNWEGYNAPQNIQLYALYLDARIRAYRELKHDAIRVQAETNRDMRLHHSIEEDMAYTTAPSSKSSSTGSSVPQRSMSTMGRKLRALTVEKGLLRETKTVQMMIDSLVECRFYLDDLEDELTITALRMLVKDLLILFQAGNEGVINVLGHYIEMSKFDAEEALGIYRNFCGQTERVVEYLGVARKLQNLLNVPIPNLMHAPVSLANSLQEYLDDPNFEQNRMEYRASNANGNLKERNSTPPAPPLRGGSIAPANSGATETPVKPPSPTPATSSKPNANHATSDFFGSIEEEQATVVNPVTTSPTGHPQQQMAHNPFVQRQMTGGFTSQPFGGQVQIQSTGFPLSLSFQPAQPFQSTQPQPTPQHRPFSTFIPQQATGLPTASTFGFLQPQPTGANPFRQSVLVSQATGMPAPVFSLPMSQMTSNLRPVPSNTQFGQNNLLSEVPARPASTPLAAIATNPSSVFPPMAQPVKSHQTGSRNPFGVPVAPVPPVPKPPTLFELSMGLGRLGIDGTETQSQWQSAATTNPQVPSTTVAVTETTFSTVASSFAFKNKLEGNVSTPAGAPDTLFSPLSSQPTNATVSLPSSVPAMGPIISQPTGYSGVRPFKPTSSFGASLLESLPPIPQSATTTPDASTHAATHTPTPSLPTNIATNGLPVSSAGKDTSVFGAASSQPTGVSPPQRTNGGFAPGIGLRPQATGVLGAANPFRATMFAATSVPSTVGGISHPFVSSTSTPLFGGLSNGSGGLPASSPGNHAFGRTISQNGVYMQQNAGASLI